MIARAQVSHQAVRVIGVVVGERHMRRPLARELARFSSQPRRALRLVESLDRQHTALSGNDASVRDGRVVSAERCGDKCPHAVRDFLEIAERFAGNDCTQRPPRPRVSQCVRHRDGGKREMCGA